MPLAECPLDRLPHDLVVLGCAECKLVIVRDVDVCRIPVEVARLVGVYAGRANGRPYCTACLTVRTTPMGHPAVTPDPPD